MGQYDGSWPPRDLRGGLFISTQKSWGRATFSRWSLCTRRIDWERRRQREKRARILYQVKIGSLAR